MLKFEFLFIALADSSRVSFAVPPSPVFALSPEPSFGTVAKLNELNSFCLDRFEGCPMKNARF